MDRDTTNTNKRTTHTDANRAPTIHRNNPRSKNTSRWSVSTKKINRRTHRDERTTSMHSTESPEENNPSIASASLTHSSTQTIPSHNEKILDANSDENNKNSHSKPLDLPKEDPVSWGKPQSAERDPILVSMQQTNGSPLS